MIKKKTLLLIRKAVMAVLAALLVILIAVTAVSAVRKNLNKAANTEDTGNAAGGKDSREEGPRQVKKETAAAGKERDAADPYAHYELAGNMDMESQEGARAAAAGAFGEWLHTAACEKDTPAIISNFNINAVEERGFKADPEAAAAKIIEEWGKEGMEALCFGYYYGDEQYVARFCLAGQREGAPELEYDLENSSIHEVTLYFDETGGIKSFLPFPELAMRSYARQYGIN